MSQSGWIEIEVVQLESRHELTLSGDKVADKVLKNGGMVDESLYEVGKQLNYLKLAKLGLIKISPKISYLSQLTQLSIIENEVTDIPLEISCLSNLVYLDLSYNHITFIPNVFNNLSKLRTINFRNNQINEISSFNGLVLLQELFLDHNKLVSLPDDTFNLGQLMVLDLSNNEIVDIPTKLSNLKNLKILNMESNHIDYVLPELGQMTRLKQLQLQNNPLKDVKTQLKKLINDNLYKAMAEYLKKLDINPSKKPSKRSSNNKKSESLSNTESGISLKILNEDSEHKIILKNRPNLARPQVVYFVVPNVLFSQDKLKKFIKFQEQLHKNECEQRKLVTIGVHDLREVFFPLVYSPQNPEIFTIQMMNNTKAESGKSLYQRLVKEAENERKVKKRGNISGVYQYLNMIDIDKAQGVVEDCNGLIVSYPPLTNCNSTKMSVETSEILVEVIGLKLDKCKSICETIIQWLIDNDVSSSDYCLEIEPVRVYEDNSDLSADSGENLLVLFPSRTDLTNLSVTVIRE